MCVNARRGKEFSPLFFGEEGEFLEISQERDSLEETTCENRVVFPISLRGEIARTDRIFLLRVIVLLSELGNRKMTL